MRADARWQPPRLAWAALLMAWSNEPTLTGRFQEARHQLAELFPGRRRVGSSYQGLLKMLGRWSPRLLRGLQDHWRALMPTALASCWTVAGWAVFAVDGTKIDLPRTTSLEKSFGVAGKHNCRPQALLTCLIHIGSGALWAFRVGRAAASERHHLRRMIHRLPLGSLLLADAGFVGYELLRLLQVQERFFLLRVGGNVKLLRDLGWAIETRGNVVYLWPDQQRRAGAAPLTLRLIRLPRGQGKTLSLLTNVLDPARLDDEQAGQLYRLRWGIELHYRALKQTFGCRKLLSQSPRAATLELQWSLMAQWLLGLVTLQAQQPSAAQARRLSLAIARRQLLTLLREPQRRWRRGDNWRRRLQQAVGDTYQRRTGKAARHWPHKKTQRPPGDPQLHDATPLQIAQARQFEPRQQAA